MPTLPIDARQRSALGAFLRSSLWNKYALVYDELLHVAPYQNLLRLVAKHSQTTPGGVICELGCGTGNLLMEMSKASESRIVGIEPAEPMLRQACEKARRNARIALLQADAVIGLRSLSSGSVDTLVLCNVLYAIADRGALWCEVSRVLAPSGKIVICHSDRGGSLPIIVEHLRCGAWRALLRPGLYAVVIIDALISFLAARGEFTFTPFGALQDELQSAGFALRFETRCYGGESRGINFLATARR
ncbi:MAG: methyltransferase domain-containing protein [Micrococcales bacterium]|nr:methyltransferase domain-containing protein [Micrococcales bacterium]